MAIHPPGEGAPPASHQAAAEAAMASQRGVVRNLAGTHLLSAPAVVGAIQLAAVLEQSQGSPREQAADLDRLQTGLGWLTWVLTERPGWPENSAAPQAAPEASPLVDLLATALEPRPAAATTLALATELASLLRCERVSFGRFERGELTIEAISHSAQLDERSRLARDLTAAMQDALDQDAVVVHPAPEGETPLAAAAHRRLAEEQSLTAVWTFPLREGDEWIGAFLVEFTAGQQAPGAAPGWLGQLASLLAPVLGMRWREEASLGRRLRGILRDDLPRALGWERLNVRLAFGATALLIALLAALPATHRVAAPAELEGVVQRAIVAPMQAYVAESRYRAGDVVSEGEVLGVLEDADLRLEARKWQAKRAQRRKELRAAMAAIDRSQVRILQAQVDQADAELALIEEQLQRTRLVAPFDGIVTHGDLSQALGTPVERGEVLFEVAPLDDYRIILEVDSADIGFVQSDQQGRLTLQALPGRHLPLLVQRVTPISTADEGRSFFRVEAALEGDGTGLRPGMDGVAKIDVGRRSLLWIWTHGVVDWLRLAWWAWVP